MVSERFQLVCEIASGSVFRRISLVYGALFFTIGVGLPFFPVWLKARGLGVEQIAVVLALQSGIRIAVSPFVSRLGERLGRIEAVMTACAVLALAAFVVMGLVEGYMAIAVVTALAFAAFSPLMPLTEACAVSITSRHGIAYGRMRMWGSLAFIGGSLFTGAALDFIAAGNVIWIYVSGLAALVAALSLLPAGTCCDAAAEGGGAAGQGGGFSFLAPAFVVFVICASLLQGGHAVVYAFSALHWKGLGYSGTVVGLLWGIGVVAEIILFWFSAPVMEKLGARNLLLLGALASVVRWSGLAVDPPLVALFILQALHGLTFGASHLGAMEYIRRHVPADRAATAQAVYGAMSGGLVLTSATWASGPLYRDYGAHAWFFMAAMALLAGGLALALKRIDLPLYRPHHQPREQGR